MAVEQDDIVRASVRFKDSNAGDVMNVFHWRYDVLTGTASDTQVMDALDAEIEALYTTIRTILSNTMDPFDIAYSVVDNQGGAFETTKVLGTRNFTMATPPNSTGDRLPPMDAAIVSARTLIPKVFGRKFLGILAEVDQQHGILTSAAVTLLGNFAGRYVSLTLVDTVGQLVPGVPSLKAGIDKAWFAHFLAALTTEIIATQRRRRKGVGA